jgi:hypothetical protein
MHQTSLFITPTLGYDFRYAKEVYRYWHGHLADAATAAGTGIWQMRL